VNSSFGRIGTRSLTAFVLLFGMIGGGMTSLSPVHADGAYGPDTCARGYAWREAAPGDHVCVTPAQRAQVAYDNSQASARRTNGAYGPDTCIQGYVWREAFSGDHVCVTPQERSRVAYDNSQARARLEANAGPTIWLTHWTVPPVCNGDTCTSTSTDDIPRFKVNGDHFTVGGQVWIGFMKASTGARTYRYSATATVQSGFTLGSFGKRSDQFDCATDPRTPVNYYVQAYDWSASRWSNRIYVKVCGAVL